MIRTRSSALPLIALLAAAGMHRLDGQEPVIPYAAPRPANTLVMLPDGSTVRVELATTDQQREYGLMGRTRLPEGRGMLFIHDKPGRYGYWMYHCKIGLDIVWMNQNHEIVEMSPDTPPCTGQANTCPTYGGKHVSLYVLELPVGDIQKHKLAAGERIEFQLPSTVALSQSPVSDSGFNFRSSAQR